MDTHKSVAFDAERSREDGARHARLRAVQGGGCASSTSPQRPSQSGSNASAPKGSTACTTARRGDQRTTADRGHYAAKPYRDVPAFVAKLQADTSVAAFCILMACCSSEVRLAR